MIRFGVWSVASASRLRASIRALTRSAAATTAKFCSCGISDLAVSGTSACWASGRVHPSFAPVEQDDPSGRENPASTVMHGGDMSIAASYRHWPCFSSNCSLMSHFSRFASPRIINIQLQFVRIFVIETWRGNRGLTSPRSEGEGHLAWDRAGRG